MTIEKIAVIIIFVLLLYVIYVERNILDILYFIFMSLFAWKYHRLS